ncbi:NitT/TauT family transport system permease protein [Pseudochelatococcus lubricantis]|uniref:NitT/TauT family transport system permease protein n=1 Tax=Pseudochelatococcus lubricantis TaxID=1538102 RepID=A0ABX0V794_9HYPH|nr:ABC transporter permease subunit [Pseudochelatococcus lubricantis]NIJ59650.1 NitT/TauT family transport system permease protein [Pseudochelatococcus lubricantis]
MSDVTALHPGDTGLSVATGRTEALTGIAAGLAWLLAAVAAAAFDDLGDWLETQNYAIGVGVFGLSFIVLGLTGRWFPRGAAWVTRAGPWLIALGLVLTLWQLAAAKLGWLPQPFFPPPQGILEVYTFEYEELASHFLASFRLLAVGFVIGTIAGFLVGVSIGWSHKAGYWVHPVLRFIGPLPATSLLPIVFFAFPSSWSASIFLIALAAGFPVAVLTWSGVANVNTAYYDVARTLGVKPLGLIFKVAIPAALPNVFIGLFMALGAAFSALMVAELVGVKAGIGFYIQWSQGWASYANVYAALILLALLCSGSITLLFRIRDRLLSWQKGLVKW